MPNHRPLPSLDLLRGFEAAARRLSFTKAAAELFLTQSAVSRQVQALEEQLGTPLFERGHRQIRLTDAGRTLYRATGEAMRLLTDAVEDVRAGSARSVTVSCTTGFASLWLVPRLMDFRAERPSIDIRIAADNRILDIEREGVELAVRYCPAGMAPAGARRLFGEEVFPVCAPGLRGVGGEALSRPDDLRHHVLLEHEHADTDRPSASWTMWLEAVDLARLRPAGRLRFSHYDQVIQAAIDGQGVALAISPLVRRYLGPSPRSAGAPARRSAAGAPRLVAPFDGRIASPRAYHLVVSRHAAGRADVAAFADWLIRNAAQEDDAADAGHRGTAKGR